MRRTSSDRPPRFLLPAILACLISACGNPTGETPQVRAVPAPIMLWMIDIANAGTAGDLEVHFNAPADLSAVSEFRVFLLDAGDEAGFDAVAAAAAPPASSVRVPAEGGRLVVGFEESATTTSGATVSDGGSYAAVVQSVSADPSLESAFSQASVVDLARTRIVRTLVPSLGAGTGGMDVDTAGNIYAADFGATLSGPPGDAVWKITPDGSASRWATGLVGASGNAFDSQGNLYQSNIQGGSISRITPDGTVSTFATGLNGGPVGIAVAPGDTLYVVNCGQNRIHKVDPDGAQAVWTVDPLFNCPNGITLADDGNFYVANFGDGDIIRVTPAGVASVHASVGGSNNGHILFGNGRLYVAVRGSHRIYEVGLDGTVTLLAGSGERGRKDGAALDAQLSLTNDIALSPDGSILYFNDVAGTSGGTQTLAPTAIRMILLDEGGAP